MLFLKNRNNILKRSSLIFNTEQVNWLTLQMFDEINFLLINVLKPVFRFELCQYFIRLTVYKCCQKNAFYNLRDRLKFYLIDSKTYKLGNYFHGNKKYVYF